jgi:hypothetical protein
MMTPTTLSPNGPRPMTFKSHSALLATASSALALSLSLHAPGFAQGTCATATDLTATAVPFGVVVTNDVSSNASSVSCYGSPSGSDVWLRLPGLESGATYQLTTSQAGESLVTDTRLEIFHGTCGALQSIGCADDAGDSLFASATFTAVDSGPYYVLLETGPEATQGSFQVSLLKITTDQPYASCDFALDQSLATLPLSIPVDTTDGSDIVGVSCAPGTGGAERWILLPPLQDGHYYTVSTGAAPGAGEQDTRLEVFAGLDCGARQSIACNDDANANSTFSSVSFMGSASASHWVMVESANPGTEGPFLLSIDAGVPATNGAVCEVAIDLTSVSFPYTGNMDLTNAISIRDSSCGPTDGAREKWFQLPELSSRIVYAVQTAQFGATPIPDTRLEVFSGECGGLKSVACNDDATPPGSGLSRLVFQGDDSKTFWLMVEGLPDDTGANQFLTIISEDDVIAPATNDTCDTAEELDSTTFPQTRTADVRAAEDDGLLAPSGTPPGGRDVYYSISPRASGRYRFTASAVDEGGALALGLWTGPDCDNLTALCGGPVVAESPVISAYLDGSVTYIITLDDAAPETAPDRYQLVVESEGTAAPESNSTCAGAVSVVALPFSVTKNSRPAPSSMDIAPALGGDACQGELYYHVNAALPISLEVTASMADGTPAVLQLFKGACGSLDSDADPALGSARFRLAASTDYYIVVEPMLLTDPGNLTFDLNMISGPSNEACATAQVIAAAPYSTQVEMQNAADEGIESECVITDRQGARRDLFWTFTPTSSGNYRIDAGVPGERGSSPDTAIAVYTGACGALQKIACRNATQAGEFLTVTMNAGTVYRIQVESDGENSTAPIDPFTFSLVAVAAASGGNACGDARELTNADLPFTEAINLAGNNALSPREGGGPSKAYRLTSDRRGKVTVLATPTGQTHDLVVSTFTDVCDFRFVNWYTNSEETSVEDAAGGGAAETHVFEIQHDEPAIIYVDDKSGSGGAVNVQISLVEMADTSSWLAH